MVSLFAFPVGIPAIPVILHCCKIFLCSSGFFQTEQCFFLYLPLQSFLFGGEICVRIRRCFVFFNLQFHLVQPFFPKLIPLPFGGTLIEMVQLGLVHIVVGVIQIVHRSHLLKIFKIFFKKVPLCGAYFSHR